MSLKRGSAELGQDIDGYSLDAGAALSSAFGTNCFPLLVAVGAVTPLIVWLVLYFIQPKFIQTRKDTGYAPDNWKLLKWTAVITIGIWLIFWAFTFCKDYKQQTVCLG
uniref:Transmembrane domain containing protein n=1 Tax=Marseillevirus sp. TaxID=2809551 RepID=A0AA96ELW7_9VIRU|nr:transmembrane domain containing protein [Marseillevirus sp.]